MVSGMGQMRRNSQVNMMGRWFVLCLALALVASCSNGVCPTVVRTAVIAQTNVSDGFRALDQVNSLTRDVPMPESTLKELRSYAANALKILTQINGVLSNSITGCSEPNLDDKLKAFNRTWAAVKAVLSLFCEKAGVIEYVGVRTFSGQISVHIPDPIFYEEP